MKKLSEFLLNNCKGHMNHTFSHEIIKEVLSK